MTFDYRIGDRHFTLADVDQTPARSDVITLQRSVDGDIIDLIDMFLIQEAGTITRANSADYTNKSANIFFVGNDGTLNVAQQFSWSDPFYQPPQDYPDSPDDWPHYDYENGISLSADGVYNGMSYSESISASITEFTIGPRSVAVSEPPTLKLLGAALVFLLAGRYRKQLPSA